MGGDRRPAFQFYPGDWMADPDLQSCSLAAQGLWMFMLCVMHYAEPYGHLVTKRGSFLNISRLAKLTGSTGEEIAELLDELNEMSVFSTTEDDVIYSRRMVADYERYLVHRDQKRAAGVASGRARRERAEERNVNEPVQTETNGDERARSSRSNPPSPSPSPSPKKERTALGDAGGAWGLNWIIDTWNDTADRCGLSKIRVMNDHRCRVATRRINEHGAAEVRRALEAPRQSKYLCGLLPGKPWKVTFDWLMTQENMLKVLEGNFRDSKPVVPPHMRVGESPDFEAWHADDVAGFGKADDQHPRWDEYFEACADDLGYDIEWPRFEKWIKDNPS